MWELVCSLLPVLAFFSGTFLGGLIMYFFNKEQRRHLETSVKNSTNTNLALESQLKAKTILESDLARTNSELQKLRRDIYHSQSVAKRENQALASENDSLKKKIARLKSYELAPRKNYVNEYQQFLSELEKSIKKAKKKTRVISRPEKLSHVDKKKKKSKKKGTDKYDSYKNKYSGKKFDVDRLNGLFEESSRTEESVSIETRDLTYLYGINAEIQSILNKHGIKTYTDLSLTKIAELKAILTLEGFDEIDPLNWPIQARVAEKGQWEILDEYKSKML